LDALGHHRRTSRHIELLDAVIWTERVEKSTGTVDTKTTDLVVYRYAFVRYALRTNIPGKNLSVALSAKIVTVGLHKTHDSEN
jgi:hypothetical protein